MPFIIASFILMISSLFLKRKISLIVSIFVSLYFIFTYGYGYDWINYYLWYNNIDAATTPIIEPGFYQFMKLSYSSGLSFGKFMSLVSIFDYISLYIFSRRFKNPQFAFFCIFSFFSYFMYAVQLRQGIAISIILLGLRWDDNYKIKKSCYLYILIASFFHVSALFSFIYIYLDPNNKREFKRSFYTLSVFTLIIISIYLNPSIVSFLPYIGDKISAYRMSFSQYNSDVLSFLVMLLVSKYTFIYLLMMALIYLCYKQDKDESMFRGILSFYFLILTKSSPFLLRFGYYFVPAIAISLDGYLEKRKDLGKFYFKKTLIHLSIFIISSSPLWSIAAYQSTLNVLNIFNDSENVISKNIQEKCTVVYKNKFSEDVLTYCYH